MVPNEKGISSNAFVVDVNVVAVMLPLFLLKSGERLVVEVELGARLAVAMELGVKVETSSGAMAALTGFGTVELTTPMEFGTVELAMASALAALYFFHSSSSPSGLGYSSLYTSKDSRWVPRNLSSADPTDDEDLSVVEEDEGVEEQVDMTPSFPKTIPGMCMSG